MLVRQPGQLEQMLYSAGGLLDQVQSIATKKVPHRFIILFLASLLTSHQLDLSGDQL